MVLSVEIYDEFHGWV